MNVGDLVDFHSSSWVFENAKRDYANPGIILKEFISESHPSIKTSKRFQVYWADGKVTTEFACYVRLARENNESR